MHIIAIGWIYVVLLMSFTEESFIAGVATFLLYGLAPLALLLYLMSTPQRRRNRRKREASAAAEASSEDVEAPLAHEAAKPQAPS